MANLSAVLFDVRLAFFALFVIKLLIYSVFFMHCIRQMVVLNEEVITFLILLFTCVFSCLYLSHRLSNRNLLIC